MIKENIKEDLFNLSRPEMKEMQSRIVNSAYPVLGSRVGDIRKLAKTYSKDLKIIEEIDNEIYEEILLKGFVIAYNKNSILNKIDLIKDYLKLVDSWALIDSFCSTFKIKETEKEDLFPILEEFLNSDNEFQQRFAQIMFLSHYLKYDSGKKLSRPKVVKIEDLEKNLKSEWIEPILNLIDRPYSTYYAQMGAAWVFAEAFLFFPKRIIEFLDKNNLDRKTFNMTIDKIVQSNTPNKEVKEFVKTYRLT